MFEQIANVFCKTRLRKLAGAMLLGVSLLFYGMLFQGSRGLWERDEGRYTNIALQMLHSGNFIVPAFNDDVPHFAKPPLTYWAIAGGITLLGRNEWGARLPNALAFIGTMFLVFVIARKVTPERPWLPPVIYATSIVPFFAANFVTTDTLLTLWETVAVLGFVCWYQRGKKRQGAAFLLIMWGGFGLAFLTKGPPGLLPLTAILVFVLLTEGWRSVLRLFSFSGLVTMVAVGFSWYFVVAATHPGLATYFIRDEFVKRIATGMHGRNSEWYMAFIVYGPVLLIGTLPWTFPLVRAARSIRKTLFSQMWWRNKLKEDQWVIFLILWVILPLAVFMFSKSRLPLYVLPLFVPIALMTGRLITLPSKRSINICLLALWVVVLMALKFAGALFPYSKDSRAMAQVISGIAQPVPKEVAFIDTEPSWGLTLYLDCEVERLVSSSQPGTPTDETLGEELKEKKQRVLFVVEKGNRVRVIKICKSLGYPARELGQTGSWVFIALQNEFNRTMDLPANYSER